MLISVMLIIKRHVQGVLKQTLRLGMTQSHNNHIGMSTACDAKKTRVTHIAHPIDDLVVDRERLLDCPSRHLTSEKRCHDVISTFLTTPYNVVLTSYASLGMLCHLGRGVKH